MSNNKKNQMSEPKPEERMVVVKTGGRIVTGSTLEAVLGKTFGER